MARGRPRSKGARFPSGKLKPPEPNARVVELRRSLLAANDPDAKVDISKAENPLDLAYARGWIREDFHQAARVYAAAWTRHSRRVMGEVPRMKVSRDATAYSSSLAHAGVEEEGPLSSGIRTPADFAYAKAVDDFEAGRIDIRALNKAEKAHRAARINWAQMPAEQVAAIFWSALSIEAGAPRSPTPDQEERQARWDRWFLRRVWHKVEPAACKELYDVAVLESWPQWIVWMAAGKQVPEHWDRKRLMLFKALGVIHRVLNPPAAASDAPDSSTDLTAQPVGPKLIERTEYIDAEGNLLYEVERRVRR